MVGEDTPAPLLFYEVSVDACQQLMHLRVFVVVVGLFVCLFFVVVLLLLLLVGWLFLFQLIISMKCSHFLRN